MPDMDPAPPADELDVREVPRRTFVREIRALDATDSTNSVALEWSARLRPRDLPALVVTESQTAGRGRGPNRWWSGPGALTFSLLLEPGQHQVTSAQWPALSLTAGAAVAAAVATTVPSSDVRLKWPNDVFFAGRKGAGVLIESPPTSAERLVIGIGVNVNNSLADAPDDVRARAVSLCDVAGTVVSRSELLIAILQQLEQDLQLLSGRRSELQSRWRKLCLLTGRTVVVTDSTRTVAGTCLGLDDDGALRVQTGQNVERLFSGVVTDFA